jgi:uncharacterized protein (DUF433 family)
MKQWETVEAIEKNPEIVSGAWVFKGTRVPVAALFQNLKDGATIDEFLEWFPGVTRAQVEAVLDHENATNLVALAETALSEDWQRPEEDEAWSHLAQLPSV